MDIYSHIQSYNFSIKKQLCKNENCIKIGQHFLGKEKNKSWVVVIKIE